MPPTDIVQKRKFHNRTNIWVGVTLYDAEGKPGGYPVEPGGSVWMSPEEERLTAEAPRQAKDNPFVAEWDKPVATDEHGNVTATEKQSGMIVLAEDDERPIGSNRFTPSAAAAGALSAEEMERGGVKEEPEELTGAPPQPQQEPEELTREPEEIVGTPDAIVAQDEHTAARRAIGDSDFEAVEPKEGEPGSTITTGPVDPDGPTPVPPAGRPQGLDAIKTPEPAIKL